MSYSVVIDAQRRRVVTKWGVAATDEGLMAYQESVWSDPAVQFFDEVIDFRATKEISVTADGLRAVAGVAAARDDAESLTRFAIVVGNAVSFGLARMYEAFRGLEESATREVMVFDDLDSAIAWLDESRAESDIQPY